MKIFSKKVEFHILQTFPVSCLNRDDVGSPKSAIIGGVNRARVSSQCWKRAIRLTLADLGVKLGLRTKKLEDNLLNILVTKGLSKDDAEIGAKALSSKISDDTLVFVSNNELDKLAELYIVLLAESQKEKATKKDGKKEEKFDIGKEIEKKIKAIKKEPLDALDIALFGRMVAKASNMDVEAACSFTHAISTHKVNTEIDFFTAMDDLQNEQGSAHMGAAEYNSATYYRYVCLDIEQLKQTLGDDEKQIKTAISNFVKALFLAVPSAKQHVMTAMCPWNYAKVLVREGQPIQLPFEIPVSKDLNGGYLQNSITEVEKGIKNLESNFGSLFKKNAEITYNQNNGDSIDKLIDELLAAI